MSWRDELQFWPRPPAPQISDIILICGEELHDMLRGVVRHRREAALTAQNRADALLRAPAET
jgi:multiple sugar transport system substrate-binding protein